MHSVLPIGEGFEAGEILRRGAWKESSLEGGQNMVPKIS